MFLRLGLAFERKADAPKYWKYTKMEGSGRGFGVISEACEAGIQQDLPGLDENLILIEMNESRG
jgi:hypothetical protein